jgi:nucleoside-specific outer membrane channel protein Tsx
MNFKPYLLATALISMAAGSASAADIITKAPPMAPVPFFLFMDTQISYWHEFRASEPGVGTNIQKDIVTITHFDVWRMGTNFVNIDFLKSDTNDPSAPGVIGRGDGAFEVYALYRGTLGFNEIFGTKAFTFGPVKDIAFYFGGDANTKNTTFAPQKRDVVAGLQVQFAVPGYFNVAVNYYKEWNHNGIVPVIGFPPGTAENVEFKGTLEFEAQYMQPLGFTGLPLRFSGFTNVVLPKGVDGFGLQTKTELLTDNRLTLDIGKLAMNKGDLVDAFVGYRYWQNKFGNDHTIPANFSSTESTWYLGMALHMPK